MLETILRTGESQGQVSAVWHWLRGRGNTLLGVQRHNDVG